jgi:hypothetical protein
MGKVKEVGGNMSADNSSYAAKFLSGHGVEHPCFYFLAGRCRLGAKCKWTHEIGRKRAAPATPAETGASKLGGGRTCHNLERTGMCNFGDECRYSHDLADKMRMSDHKGFGSSQDHKSGEKDKRANHKPSDHKGSGKVGKVKESAGKKDAEKRTKWRLEDGPRRRAQRAAAGVEEKDDFGASSSSAFDSD